jgi:uncharacterized protein YutD
VVNKKPVVRSLSYNICKINAPRRCPQHQDEVKKHCSAKMCPQQVLKNVSTARIKKNSDEIEEATSQQKKKQQHTPTIK